MLVLIVVDMDLFHFHNTPAFDDGFARLLDRRMLLWVDFATQARSKPVGINGELLHRGEWRFLAPWSQRILVQAWESELNSNTFDNVHELFTKGVQGALANRTVDSPHARSNALIAPLDLGETFLDMNAHPDHLTDGFLRLHLNDWRDDWLPSMVDKDLSDLSFIRHVIILFFAGLISLENQGKGSSKQLNMGLTAGVHGGGR